MAGAPSCAARGALSAMVSVTLGLLSVEKSVSFQVAMPSGKSVKDQSQNVSQLVKGTLFCMVLKSSLNRPACARTAHSKLAATSAAASSIRLIHFILLVFIVVFERCVSCCRRANLHARHPIMRNTGENFGNYFDISFGGSARRTQESNPRG